MPKVKRMKAIYQNQKSLKNILLQVFNASVKRLEDDLQKGLPEESHKAATAAITFRKAVIELTEHEIKIIDQFMEELDKFDPEQEYTEIPELPQV